MICYGKRFDVCFVTSIRLFLADCSFDGVNVQCYQHDDLELTNGYFPDDRRIGFLTQEYINCRNSRDVSVRRLKLKNTLKYWKNFDGSDGSLSIEDQIGDY